MDTRVAIGLFVVATAVASFPATAGKPEVVVQFEIAVPEFTRNLPERAKAEQTLRTAFAQEFERQYVFAHWLTEPSTQTQSQIGRLVLRLEENANMRPNPQVFVRLWGSGASPSAVPKELGFEPMEIYSPGNPNWDTNSRADFETRVLTQTLTTIRSSAFKKEFFEHFIRLLPISSTVEPRASERLILIPLRWSDVLLDSDTQLLVRFDKRDEQRNLEGNMTLTHIAARTDAQAAAAGQPLEFPARLQASITKAEFNSKPITLDAENWNDQLPQMLSGARAVCFIADYKPKDDLAGDSDRLGL